MSAVSNTGQVEAFFRTVEEELVSLQTIDSFEMLREIITYSDRLGEFPRELMTEDNRVHGCQSTVFIHSECVDNRLVFSAFSDAQVLRGYLGILIEGLNGMNPDDFLQHAESLVEGFAKRTNIAASVTPTRANAFGNIFELMQKQVKELDS